MKTFTEQELRKAIEYACQYQKATDYQLAGAYLITEKSDNLQDKIIELLDKLCEVDDNAHREILLSDIF